MQLTVLVDNNTYIDEYYLGEPGVCYHIEDDGMHFLFDTGYSYIFMDNADKLNLPLGHITKIVLSHGHNDHTRGLSYYLQQYKPKNLTVIAHPDAFNEKQDQGMSIGSPLRREVLEANCRLQLSRVPVKISRHITFLGEIPARFPFEARSPIGVQIVDDTLQPDYVLDDSGLVYEARDGIYIITGCSHSGICNMVEYAKEITGCSAVKGIIGGFHLFRADERLSQTIQYFKEHPIAELYPCHCVSFNAKAEIHKYIPIKEIGVGKVIKW